MNKFRFFIFLNIYTLMMYMAYSSPTIFFPNLASSRNLDSIFIAFFFSAFPLGAFPASILTGKLMRFYRKDHLLIASNVLLNISRICIGLLYYIDDIKLFFIVSFISRMLTGVAEGCMIPIIYSYIPEFYPDDIMKKFGILEICGSLGVILGSPFSSFIYDQVGYFAVFAIISIFNLIVGCLIIIFFLKSSKIECYGNSEKKSLSIKAALFNNNQVLLNFFYLFFFYFPNYMILPGYELYIYNLTQSYYVSSFVYSFIYLGMMTGVIIIIKLRNFNENKMLFLLGIPGIFALIFYGPDPIFKITDYLIEIMFMSIAFFIVGIVIEITFLILTKKLIKELTFVFPEDHKLCADFANGLYTACFSLDQMFGPIVGSILSLYMGYERSVSIFAIVLLGFFIFYWITNCKRNKSAYDEMKEEKIEDIST